MSDYTHIHTHTYSCVLTIPRPVVPLRTAKSYLLPTQCIYVFRTDLRTKAIISLL